jgi:hypothetical protein
MLSNNGNLVYLRRDSEQVADVFRYWLEKQKSTEPFIFLMYDTHAKGKMARCKYTYTAFCVCLHPIKAATVCPHVSFDNMRKPPDAELRTSVETRSIVITKIE